MAANMWNRNSDNRLIRRLQDEQARIQDQVNRNEDVTYDRILDLRDSVSDLKSLVAEQALEIREMKKELEDLKEFRLTAKLAKPRNPQTCSSCGGNHRCDSPSCPKPKERYFFKGEVSKKV